jgi:predicted RNA-binding Zn-ribbon protein involved in translation (DUF1610 family)
MSITVRFTCGHGTTVGEQVTTAPTCPTCGETRIARTLARPPRFTGACSGPYCESKAVEPAIVDLTQAGSLKLKEEH